MVLAAGAIPRAAAAQNNTPAATSPLSADDAFLKGSEAFNRKDFAQALSWLRQAADQGNARAQGMLGGMYQNGEGVKQNYAQALLWNRKAADQGLAVAQANLGIMYANGIGVTQDLGKAIEWSEKAAAQGVTQAQQNLESLQHVAQGPSDDEIIQLVKDRVKHDAIESITAEYAGVDKMTTDAVSIFQAKSKAAVSVSLACSLNAPKDRSACLEKMKTELLAERSARLKKTQNSDLGTEFVYSIQDKTNYENNYVTFVNIRQRGTDKTFRWKLLLQFARGAWTIAKREEQEIN